VEFLSIFGMSSPAAQT